VLSLKLLDEELYAGDLVEGLSGKAVLVPRYQGDAGLDLRARDDVRIFAGQTAEVRLGVAVEVPEGFVGWLTGRSTTSLTMGLFVHEGKIDAGYRGEIHCFCTAQGSPVEVNRGDRLCQLVVVAIQAPRWEVVSDLSSTARNTHGLGSTGRT
jgi:dUTP diphosphatase